MAFVIADRVKETCISPGVGTVTLLGASTGYQSFSAVGDGNSTYYCIADQNGNNWEVGIGSYTASGTTLSRTTVLASSNGGAKTNFSAGTQDVFVTQPSERAVYVDSAGSAITPNVSATLGVLYGGTGLNTLTANRIPYGNGTSAFQSSAGLTFDGTTLTASNISSGGSFTFSGGTANGVLYLNGSKVATSGSALVFDGTNLGIGVVPQAKLEVGGSIRVRGNSTNADYFTQGELALKNAGSNPYISFHLDGGGRIGYIWGRSGNYFRIQMEENFPLELITATSYISLTTNSSERMRLDSSGNLGLGVTPSAWYSSIKALQIGGYTAVTSSPGYATLGSNWFSNAAGTNTYLNNDYASLYQQNAGKHAWFTAPSGTAGAAITFTQAMTLDASGNLLLGTTSSPTAAGMSVATQNASGQSRIVINNAGLTTVGATGGYAAYLLGDGSTRGFHFLYRGQYATLNRYGVTVADYACIESYGPSCNGMIIGTASSTPILFGTNEAERMRIDSSGNVGIGTTSTGAKLDVNGSEIRLYNQTAAGTARLRLRAYDNNTASYLSFDTGGVIRQEIVKPSSSSNLQFRSYPTGSAVAGYEFYVSNGLTESEAMRLDSSGNLGLGVTPSAWMTASSTKALQVGYTTIAGAYPSSIPQAKFGSNFYQAADTFHKYTVNGYATMYEQSGGGHYWNTAPSGTAGNSITFTQAMTLDASGQLAIGNTSASYKLDVTGPDNTGGAGVGIYSANRTASLTIGYGSISASSNSGGLSLTSLGANAMTFANNGSERMRLDSSGNLGLGVTPSAWASVYKAIDLNTRGLGVAGGVDAGSIGVNAYYDTLWKYKGTSSIKVTRYDQYDGQHIWSTAPSGTAGSAITFTQAMTLDASGRLGIGTTSPAQKLDVSNAGAVIARLINTSSNADAALLTTNTTGSGYFGINNFGPYIYTGDALPVLFYTNTLERMRIHASGGVSIGNTTDPGATNLLVTGSIGAGNVSPTALLTLAAGTATANTGPLKFTSGTNLTTPEAGAVEYDGTVMTATSNTSFKRGTIPLTNYVSGAGTNLTGNAETTLQNLLPAANDTITLPSGTYFLDIAFIVTRTGTSNTSATARLNILGGGNAAGNFTGMSISAIIAGGASNNFSFSAVNINTSNVLTAASTTVGGVYTMTLRGMLKITTAGTIVPQYNLSATLGAGGAGGASVSVLYMRLQQIDSQNNTTVGPAGTGWA